MKNVFCLLVLAIFIYSCRTSSTDNYLKLPKLNPQYIDTASLPKAPSKFLLISSGSFLPSTDVILNGINFTIVLNEKGDTIHWTTRDMKFITPEGFNVGTSWENVPKKLQKSIRKMPGWGYYIKLNSEWQLGFCEGKTCTNNEPSKGSNVNWIFKRGN